jgi:cytochrome b561
MRIKAGRTKDGDGSLFCKSCQIRGRWVMFMDARRSVLWAQLQSVGVTTMSSATTSVATVSAYTEQPAPGAESRSQSLIPAAMWTVLILAFLLLLLLAWRAIEEAGDASGGNSDSSTWFPPY